ncbi:MAG: SMC family ATPase [Nitrososphaerota archaeon]|nr:SMC family ATPase [Nitrososphaerota archaeon]MDG6977645.1 SMC family ATPase [Nitrososphaerota archaeon]MDG7021849.1 SMC family ATPase [Nitrososphaerota archaeon]
MIVRRLRMENVRSYRQAEVEFPMGKTLFEGDIGSGKSTILMAIEFALFGLGSARASSLLRIGESRGSVDLDFESGGSEYSVRRVLAKKGGSIQQVEGKLKGPGGEEDYPPSELKERILAILNFREPTDPRSRSLIFQYAIYSPQEEMKLILALPARDRVQILRRAFGLEEYKVAMENAAELLRRVREKKSLLEFASKDASSLKREAEALEEKARKGDEELRGLEGNERAQEESLRSLMGEKEGLHELEVQLASALRDRKHLREEADGKKREAEETAMELDRLAKKKQSLAPASLGPPPTEMGVPELRAAVSSLRIGIEKHRASEVEIGVKVRQFGSISQNGRCPVCERPAEAREFDAKARSLSQQLAENSIHLQELKGDLDELEGTLEKRREYDAALAKVNEERERAREYEEEWERKNGLLAKTRDAAAKSEKDLADLEVRIRVLESEAAALEPLNRKIEAAQKELDATRGRIVALGGDARRWREDAKRRSDSAAHKDGLAAKASALGEREIWLAEYYIPTVESIEKHVMVSINQEFALSFQKWFGMLVEDGEKEAAVDDEFTPTVSQEGYDQDLESLSGGERTSVALAYRLALSQMVRRFAEGATTPLILDEPTDGFSKEQLGRVREILDEMANPQVIIVSHERELDSMADQIYRVAKVGNESKISR